MKVWAMGLAIKARLRSTARLISTTAISFSLVKKSSLVCGIS